MGNQFNLGVYSENDPPARLAQEKAVNRRGRRLNIPEFQGLTPKNAPPKPLLRMVPEKLTFSPLGFRLIEVDFSAGHMSSDSGTLTLSEVGKRHGLTRQLAGV